MPQQLRTAERYYRFSERLAQRAVARAKAARSRGTAAVAAVVIQHQATQANEVDGAMTAMLAEQGLREPAEAALNALAFTTAQEQVEAMLAEIQQDVDWEFERLVSSIVQDAGRAAQAVETVTRPHIVHVRHLNLPSCSRCAVLAGREYRWSTGFKRHPGCDCVMIPTTVAAPDLTYDPEQLARDGLIRGLSKADLKALDDGADFGQIVNVRNRKAGLMEAGQALTRAGRPTPAGIYRLANGDRDAALNLLKEHRYIT
jgi:hypothetical protein